VRCDWLCGRDTNADCVDILEGTVVVEGAAFVGDTPIVGSAAEDG